MLIYNDETLFAPTRRARRLSSTGLTNVGFIPKSGSRRFERLSSALGSCTGSTGKR